MLLLWLFNLPTYMSCYFSWFFLMHYPMIFNRVLFLLLFFCSLLFLTYLIVNHSIKQKMPLILINITTHSLTLFLPFFLYDDSSSSLKISFPTLNVLYFTIICSRWDTATATTTTKIKSEANSLLSFNFIA